MGGWRGCQRCNCRKPPSGSWQPTVPSREKKFCTSICLIPWGKLCETKKLMSFYNNIVEWNDSAGKEAFQNAKTRFWAEINGFHCDILLPDPDRYIDDINWNSEIDPELLEDLDREPPVSKDGEPGSLGSGLYSALLNQPVICTGWGDADDPVPPFHDSAMPEQEEQCDRNAKNSNTCESGWGDDRHTNVDNKENSYNSNAWGHSKWASQVAENNSWGHWEHKVKEAEHMESRNNGRDWRSKANDHRKQEQDKICYYVVD